MRTTVAWISMSIGICLAIMCSIPVDAAEGDPTIVWGPNAGSGHFGIAGSGSQYGLYLGIKVADPKGIENIDSVSVTAPDSTTVYVLNDDGFHCDEAPNDGVYGYECGGNSTSPPQMGTYTFTITNKNDPPQTISQTAEVSTILDLPTNPSPAGGSYIGTATPTLTWGAVNGAVTYNLEVRKVDGFQLMWFVDNVADTSIVYNADGSGTDLQSGMAYLWGVGARDGQGNYSWYHTVNSFVYSNTEEPILSGPSVGGRVRIGNGVEYALYLNVNVSDPKGLENIESVIVEDGYGHSYQLWDDGQHADNGPNDGTFSVWVNWQAVPFPLGSYSFTVLNKDGLSAVATDTLEAYPDPPTNLIPANGSVIFNPTPTFSWDNQGLNNAWINLAGNRDASGFWSSWNISGNSKTYDGPPLEQGIPYRWSLGVSDDFGNGGQADNRYFIYYPSGKLADTWYDRFDEDSINRYKWEYWDKDMVREIRNGQLRLNIGGDSFGVNRMDLRLNESDALDYLEAKVLVESGSRMSSGANGYARIAGYFYNDSRDGSQEKPYDGYLDDIFIELKIVLDDQGQLKLNSYMERTSDTLGNQGSTLLNEDWTIPVAFDVFYTLSIQMDWENAQVIFSCNDQTYTYPITTGIHGPSGREYKLRTRLNTSDEAKGIMRARYDDVVIGKGAGHTLYEDFSGSSIDMAKWLDKEDVKEIESGAMRLAVRGMNPNGNTTNQISPVFRSNYMEAKVSLESGSFVNGNRGVARLTTQFYNDTHGEGSGNPAYRGDEGEIFSIVFLQMNTDNTLVAKAYIERADDPDWNNYTTLLNHTFATPVELDKQYRLSVELKDAQLIFKCNEEKIVYPITTDIYPSKNNWMAVTSRVYAGTGGLIKANFDDIRLYNRDYGLGDVLAILGSSAGVDQQSVKDIDDFTDDSYVDVADTISILRYIAGLRNWP